MNSLKIVTRKVCGCCSDFCRSWSRIICRKRSETFRQFLGRCIHFSTASYSWRLVRNFYWDERHARYSMLNSRRQFLNRKQRMKRFAKVFIFTLLILQDISTWPLSSICFSTLSSNILCSWSKKIPYYWTEIYLMFKCLIFNFLFLVFSLQFWLTTSS